VPSTAAEPAKLKKVAKKLINKLVIRKPPPELLTDDCPSKWGLTSAAAMLVLHGYHSDDEENELRSNGCPEEEIPSIPPSPYPPSVAQEPNVNCDPPTVHVHGSRALKGKNKLPIRRGVDVTLHY